MKGSMVTAQGSGRQVTRDGSVFKRVSATGKEHKDPKQITATGSASCGAEGVTEVSPSTDESDGEEKVTRRQSQAEEGTTSRRQVRNNANGREGALYADAGQSEVVLRRSGRAIKPPSYLGKYQQ